MNLWKIQNKRRCILEIENIFSLVEAQKPLQMTESIEVKNH
jgi:hypothetical protein